MTSADSSAMRPSDASAAFLRHLISELLVSCQRREFDNIDRMRFGDNPQSSVRAAAKTMALRAAALCGFHRFSAMPAGTLEEVLRVEDLGRAYSLLTGQRSKDLFVKLLAYRILGSRHVRLPLNDAKYWKSTQALDKCVEKRQTIGGIPVLGSLDLINFNGIRLHAHRLNILNTFILQQYRYEPAGIGVSTGDVVIDAGGGWGDTALYFAQNAARVFCFECIPSNVKVMQQNLEMNATLAPRIRIVPSALWSRSHEKLAFEDRGPGSKPGSSGLTVEVVTQTLDDFVSANSVRKVDFVKMDIEGAEPQALVGAEQTIRKHRPQLAISLYHHVEHFASIPKWIADLDLGYKLYLDHFTIHSEETILFARVD